MPTIDFSTSGTSTPPARLDVSAREFTLTIDEPPALGGTDAGANPVEYVLAALSGCLNVVIHMIAAERGITIEGMTIRARGALDPARLSGRKTEARAGFQSIEVEVDLRTDASAEQVADLLRAAEERCPVSDNLAHPTPISIAPAAG